MNIFCVAPVLWTHTIKCSWGWWLLDKTYKKQHYTHLILTEKYWMVLEMKHANRQMDIMSLWLLHALLQQKITCNKIYLHENRIFTDFKLPEILRFSQNGVQQYILIVQRWLMLFISHYICWWNSLSHSSIGFLNIFIAIPCSGDTGYIFFQDRNLNIQSFSVLCRPRFITLSHFIS